MAVPIQIFNDFYRMHGVRRVDTLPDLEPVVVKRLPLNSVLHVLGDPENPQIDTSDPLLKPSDLVYFHNVRTYDPEHTGGTTVEIDMKSSISTFTRTNPRYKYLPTIAEYRRPNSRQVIVTNYAWLDLAYRYPAQKTSDFLRFENKLWAMVATIKQIHEKTKRNHFIQLDVPSELQPKSILDQRSVSEVANMARIFDTEGERILRHLWLFMNPTQRTNSVFGALTEDELRVTNLLFRTKDGRCVVLNLGYLYSWIKGDANLTPMSSLTTKGFSDVQRYYLRAMMTLQSFNDSGASVVQQIDGLDTQADKVELDQEGAEVPDEGERFPDEVLSQVRSPGQHGSDSPLAGDDQGGDGKPSADVIQPELDLKAMDKEIDQDLQVLEEIAKAKELTQVSEAEEDKPYTPDIPETAEAIRAELFVKRTPEQALLHKLQKLAAVGRLSASELRKKSELAKASGNRPDPYGSGKTINEASVVTPEMIKVPEEATQLNVPATVIDRSMAHSSLNYISRVYNTEILNKDILACVQYAQKGGVIVKNHTVDTVHSALGSYDNHTLELLPVNGMPSIIRARIPKVSEEGSFVAKGNKYSMRRQLVDVPIRKIGATRVGLTSYTGKTFVDRSTKKANSSLAYVLSKLSKATIQPDEYLRDVSPGDVFDSYFKAPYVYLGLSEQFQSFKAGDLTIDLNPKGFRKTLDPQILKKVEKNGAVIAGYAKGQKLVVIDKNSFFHLLDKTGEQAIGDIYDVLRLDRSLAPVDFAEVKVFSKGVAVGLFLARNIGFRKLVKMLGAKYRTVEGRKQKNLDSYEYVVQFKDIAYIFDRREAVNSLILAGFQEHEKELKLFDAALFDEPEVYSRLLEAKGLSVVYFREMESLEDMFIDPITERILKEMNEPTTFNELIIRSCELLTTYDYPASQDMDYQRVRGYDRFAGFLYKEIANAIRAQKSRNSTGRGKVEMSPFQVWSTITRDASVKHAEDINPIQSLKITQEAVTYVGEGGRSKESMNRESRAYVVSNRGVLSGDSVDSSDVGINAFLSADPEIASLDGLKKKGAEVDSANLMSTSMLLAPFSTMDD